MKLTEKPKVTKVMLDALAECARFTDDKRRYWWRQASMRKLHAAGLVQQTTAGPNDRLTEYVPSPAGCALLAEARDGN